MSEGVLAKRANGGPESDLEALITRMRRRLYPETIPVLASYWLKTVYTAGHDLGWWKELNRLLKSAVSEPLPNDLSKQVLTEIQDWVEKTILRSGLAPKCAPPAPHVSSSLPPPKLAPYIVRLLNQWLPVEVARLLVQEGETAAGQDGIPVLAIASALERLLIRERLSRPALEALLTPELASPEHVYPRDVEVLVDVVLSLLGRTRAPDPPLMPATLFCVAPDSRLPSNYEQLLPHTSAVRCPEGDELRVPISASDAAGIMSQDRVHIGSIIVTMDGRWWKSDNIQRGQRCWVAYRPLGRFEIDYSDEYSRLRVPWPESRMLPSGYGGFTDTFKIFGREWRISKLDVDTEHAWLHLRFFRFLSISEIIPSAASYSRDLRPASVDMAWSAVETALKSSIRLKNSEAIEGLRNPDLIPLARAIFGLAESLPNCGRKPDAMELRLKALRYLESSVASEYGRVPWRILPLPVCAALERFRNRPAILGLLNEVIEGLPEVLNEPHQKETDRTAPPHAA